MQKTYDYTEQQVKEYAREKAQLITIREYVDGNSRDYRCYATSEDSDLVERAIGAALLAIRNGYDVDAAKATAEYVVLWENRDERHINTYDSVYIPIGDFISEN